MGVDVGPKLCAVRSILLMYQPESSSSLRGTSSPPLPLSPLLPLPTSPPFPSLLILYSSLRPSPLLQFVRSPLLRTPFSIAYGLLPCVWPLYIAHFKQFSACRFVALPSPPLSSLYCFQDSIFIAAFCCARPITLCKIYSLAYSLLPRPARCSLAAQPSHLPG